MKKNKLCMVVSEDWSFWSHRLSLARFAIANNYDVTLITKVNSLAAEIQNNGIKLINVNFVRSSKLPLIDIINVFKLALIFRKEKPDIIHNVALKTIFISSIASLLCKNTSLVNAFTGLGYVFSSNQLQAKIIRFFIKPFFYLLKKKKNVWTIFQNPDDMKLFTELKLNSINNSVLIRGSGVDIHEFNQSKDTNTQPVVMLASRMLWDKGVGEFVEVAKRMKNEKIKVRFVLVGDTDLSNPMAIPIDILENWNNESDITWSGHSSNMPDTLRSASIVCLPSYREGLPKVLLEAASVGRPLVATDVPGCREIVQNGKNGLLVKLKDIDSLYEAIKTLILNDELRISMGQNSRELVESELSTDIINSQTLELYETALNKNL